MTERRTFGAVEAELTPEGVVSLRRGGVMCGMWETPEELGSARPIDANEQEAMRWAWSAMRDRAEGAR